ncbi:MAG: hypothetical protein GF353_04385 [Candidatus Lokiarchaeota archaeon]|nr:hypothetical protein [Candidatus Lokiarchaeota archaeon]
MKQKKGGNPNFKNYEDIISLIGKFAWIIGVIDGILYILWGIWGLWWVNLAASAAQSVGVFSYIAADVTYLTALYIWYIIGGIITIAVAILIVRPRFSAKCANKDWDFLLDDVITLGSFRIPFMLILGIILTIFGQWWGGVAILIPAIVLIFLGPKEYKWKK